MRPVLLFLIPALFLVVLVGLGVVLYRATATQDVNQNPALVD